MQATAIAKTRLKFEVVESSVHPNCYVAQAIDDSNEGVIIAVEFVAHDSRRLAEEYVEWKNSFHQIQPST